MFMLRKAWDAIPNSTFTDCFRKAGISQTTAESALREDDNPFTGLEAVEEDVLEMLQGDIHRLKFCLFSKNGAGYIFSQKRRGWQSNGEKLLRESNLANLGVYKSRKHYNPRYIQE